MRVDAQKAVTDEQLLEWARRGLRVGANRPEPHLKQKCDRLVNMGLLRRSRDRNWPVSCAMYWPAEAQK